MTKEIVLIGGASASGKTTFVKRFVKENTDYCAYRRVEAFDECAKELDVPFEQRFQKVPSEVVDNKIIDTLEAKQKLIHDIHYALQRGRDFVNGEADLMYVTPISDYFIEALLEKGTRVIASHIICSEEDLYKRAVLRYERGERELRANSFEDALSQREWERKLWIELYKKFNLEHIELNSSNNTPEEMTNIMNIQILSKRR